MSCLYLFSPFVLPVVPVVPAVFLINPVFLCDVSEIPLLWEQESGEINAGFRIMCEMTPRKRERSLADRTLVRQISLYIYMMLRQRPKMAIYGFSNSAI